MDQRKFHRRPVPGARRACIPIAILLLGSLLACSGAPREPDWERLEAEGRVSELPRGIDLPQNRYEWSAGMVPLRVERARAGLSTGDRLVLTLEGQSGHATPFLLDTGSSGSLLSTSAPLAEEVVVSRKARYTIVQGRTGQGRLGHLPVVRAPPLEGRDLAVGLIARRHSTNSPENVLGIVHLFHTQLEHRQGTYVLRSGSVRLPPMETGWVRIPLREGTPFVKVRSPDGTERYAMIDTGAPWSLAVEPHPEGVWEIPAADGSTALRVPVRQTANWRGLRADGCAIDLLIGMDVLASRAWRLTFDRATWALAPVVESQPGCAPPPVVGSTPVQRR